MATTIPTRIRQNIRDQITFPDAPLTTTTSKLSTLLGYPIAFDPEWGMLWTTLHSFFPDQATFIPNAVTIITTWCNAFTTWLEDETNEAAVDRLLDALKSAGRLKLVLEIAPTSTRPTTTWRPSTSSFVIGLPKARPSSSQSTLAGFASDLLELFTTSPSLLPLAAKHGESASMSASATAAADDPEAWADLSLDSPATRPVAATPKLTRVAEIPGEDFLPDIGTLERPEELSQRPPYRVIVRQEGKTKVLVESSHMGTLKVLEGYLGRWVRHNVNFVDRPPVAIIQLRESPFGLGLLYDTLIIEAGRGREVNACLVLALIENVLGYELVPGGGAGTSGWGVWEFKRIRGFK